MSEMCWKQGLNLGDTESAEHLMEYYRYHLEPELACGMTFRQRVTRTDQPMDTFNTLNNILGTNVNFSEPNPDVIKNAMTAVDINGNSGSKTALEVIQVNNRSLVQLISELKSGFEQKGYLKSPVRKGLILQHRERLKDTAGLNQNEIKADDRVILGKLKQNRAKKMATLKSITLQEMSPTKDKIYENRILDLTVIEEPNLYYNSIQLIAEDDNGDTTRVYVDPVAGGNILQKFAIGSRVAIINPYMGICAKGEVNCHSRLTNLKCQT